jgi:hypothetical protein
MKFGIRLKLGIGGIEVGCQDWHFAIPMLTLLKIKGGERQQDGRFSAPVIFPMPACPISSLATMTAFFDYAPDYTTAVGFVQWAKSVNEKSHSARLRVALRFLFQWSFFT